MSVPAAIAEARRLNEEHDLGMGVRDRARAVEVAEARFDGDILLGLLWVSADGYAVAVGHRLPTAAERAEARANWNDGRAREAKAALLADGHETDTPGPRP